MPSTLKSKIQSWQVLAVCCSCFLISSCGSHSSDVQQTTPQSKLEMSWGAESYTFAVSPNEQIQAQIDLDLNQPADSLSLNVSSSLGAVLSAPLVMTNVSAGTHAIPITLKSAVPAVPGTIPGQIKVSGDGATSTVNVFVNVWNRLPIPGTSFTFQLPPNTSESIVGDERVYSSVDGSEAFELQVLNNPSNLAINSFIDAQVRGSQMPVSPFDDARDGSEPVSSGAQEVILFKGVGDYEISDEAYVRIPGQVLVFSEVGLPREQLKSLLESIRSQ